MDEPTTVNAILPLCKIGHRSKYSNCDNPPIDSEGDGVATRVENILCLNEPAGIDNLNQNVRKVHCPRSSTGSHFAQIPTRSSSLAMSRSSQLSVNSLLLAN
jgi:hypothetical protein